LAQYNLGMAYRNGDGVAKDEAEAKQWLQKAADQGDKDAASALK
jgi:TPR repeat protein